MKRHYTLIIFLISILFYSPLYPKEESNNLLFLGGFLPYKHSIERATEDKILGVLQKDLSGSGFTYKVLAASTWKENVQKASKGGGVFYISGFYSRSTFGNLTLYGQIYDPESGNLIDAYSVTDEASNFSQIRLPAEENKIDDSEVIKRFSEKILLRIRLNTSKKEKRENINEYLLASPLGQELNFPIRQEDPKSAGTEVFDLIQSQITTSATKFERRANEAPNLVSIIRDTEIKEYGRISLNDVIYQLPGFAASQDYDRRTVSSRGMFEGWNNNHLMLLMDGVQFNDNLYGSAYTWEITPLNLIKSLEVVRGPGSALYGSNATNGVISINTYSGKDIKGELRTRVRYGDYGTRIYDFLTGNTGEYFSYVLSVNSYETNGNEYESRDGSGRRDIFGQPAQFKINDARKNGYVFAKIEGEKHLKGLSIQYHQQNWSFGTGHGWLWRIPDFQESMSETRQLATIKYTNQITDKLSQEYVLRYQRHGIEWNTRYGENGAYDNYYPAGIWEYLNTSARDVLGRAQLRYSFGKGGSLLGGVEADQFLYGGDKDHNSNAALSDVAGGYPPNPDNATKRLGPWLEWIKDIPIYKVGAFGQLVSGKLFGDHLEITLGVRYDEMRANFKSIDKPYSDVLPFDYEPRDRLTFRRTSPRVGIVYFARKDLTIKAMAGRAFREPSITELFGANTFSLASNPRHLKPEIITTGELALDWFANKYMNFRVNVFRTKFENQIAYSIANNNLSTNIYSLTTEGSEGELLLSYQKVSGFLNYSYSRRLDEKIDDTTVAPSKSQVTWAPAHTGNIGIRYEGDSWSGSFSVQRQGRVYRRESDYGQVNEFTQKFYGVPSEEALYRTKSVDPWVQANLRLMYKLGYGWEIGLYASNVMNSAQTLLKNNLYPFDYQREGRRVFLEISGKL
ncbi:TonB-dependent receptor [Leptospira perolatii]|uniref:TonB-dependent receptor n=1 Tax=Leptospira perolatii TaxID=2023191 RepID=A0A2M9ZLT2_9LEPT|nr:TonB-dependent receptor [Leptospira perolatii]PJZ69810.1 TonB-dependent receptor [Leptospira perolatii]PJZ72975.1 TonB-dependent receptor [Leptospira perolatii]